MFLFFIRVRLIYSYRIVAGLQGLALLIFSQQMFLYAENEFGLRILSRSNGYYEHTSRMEPISVKYAYGPFVLFGCYFVALFGMYPLSLTFVKRYEDFQTYLLENSVHFLYSFYFFASRMMFYYIGLWIQSISTSLSVIIPFCIFALLIVLILVKFFYDFHKNSLSPS